MILDKTIWTQGQRCWVRRKEAVYNVVQQYYKIANNEFCSSVQFLDLNPIILFFLCDRYSLKSQCYFGYL